MTCRSTSGSVVDLIVPSAFSTFLTTYGFLSLPSSTIALTMVIICIGVTVKR